MVAKPAGANKVISLLDGWNSNIATSPKFCPGAYVIAALQPMPLLLEPLVLVAFRNNKSSFTLSRIPLILGEGQYACIITS
jgi:hypothetical protein